MHACRRIPTRAILVLILLPGSIQGAEPSAVPECKPWLAEVVSVQGTVETKRAGLDAWNATEMEDRLCQGDTVRTGKRSRAGLWLTNQTVLRLDQESTATFLPPPQQQSFWVDILKGAAHFISRVPRTLRIRTPFVNAAVDGTEFTIRVKPTAAKLWVIEGRVLAENTAGELILTGGESAIAEASAAPRRWLKLSPRDAIQWTLYYPPLLDDTVAGTATVPEAIAQVLSRYGAGDLPAAFAALEAVPASQRTAAYYNTKASLLLSVGRIDEARGAIDESVRLEPGNGDATALQSVMALANNDRAQALALARRATASAPNAPIPHMALSYAHQAQFDLKRALESVREALEIDSTNALAWARLAELELSLGEFDKGLEAANEATRLKPRLARTQTVLGFSYLTRIEIDEARAAFEKAIRADQADPLPRLGLGLAEIRRGDLEEGRRQIEIAAGLDPGRSLTRSYLGKAYYEERRDGLAQSQLAMAKDLDPGDPTPWFYDAIRKQSENRPVEALHDLQASIQRNDNRAVYRSRLLLDQDLAARNASLGRIYSDLGFEQRALVEGWRSLEIDPAEHSAHRLLADTYRTLRRHQVARVSELLQAQLLQPLNVNPVQPQLAESNLGILDGTGPSQGSLNEHNPLFVRNRIALQANGVAGGNDTLGNDLLLAGIWDNVAAGIGQFHFETEGFRPNADQNQDIYDAYVQGRLSHRTTVQAEYRVTSRRTGDTALHFGATNFSPAKREKEHTRSVRAGLKHAFSPRSTLLANIIRQKTDQRIGDVGLGVRSDAEGHVRGHLGELQHLWRGEKFGIISGIGYYGEDRMDSTVATFSVFLPAVSTLRDTDTRHRNAYMYGRFNPHQALSITVGASADALDGSGPIFTRHQINPKLGLTWQAGAGTRVRMAAFRMLKRTLIADQTIEPTQVAGFNQLFDDGAGTDAWRFGAALDHDLGPSAFVGAEISARHLEVPVRRGALPSLLLNWEEQSARAYGYWTPRPWLALNAEYLFERFERDPDVPADFLNLRTHQVSLGMRLHDPTGFFAAVEATGVRQSGQFVPVGTTIPNHDQDTFWVLDASLGYRLPRRRGLLSIGIKNALDEEFNFEDTDLADPRFQPDRLIFARFSLPFD